MAPTIRMLAVIPKTTGSRWTCVTSRWAGLLPERRSLLLGGDLGMSHHPFLVFLGGREPAGV